jgi:hypothetical protein
MIHSLGKLVLKKACRQLKIWNSQRDVPVRIPLQLMRSDFVSEVNRLRLPQFKFQVFLMVHLDSIVIGFYRGKELHYAARLRAGFVPATRRQVFNQIKHLETKKCLFVNLPEKEVGRWGQGLTAEKMKDASG